MLDTLKPEDLQLANKLLFGQVVDLIVKEFVIN